MKVLAELVAAACLSFVAIVVVTIYLMEKRHTR